MEEDKMMAERDRQVNTNEIQEQSIGSKEERTPSGDRQDVSNEKSLTSIWKRMAQKREGLVIKGEEEKRVRQLAKAIGSIGRGKPSKADVLTAVKRIVPAVAVGAGSLAGGAGVVEAARGDQVGDVEAQEGEEETLQASLDNWLSGETVLRDEERFRDSGEWLMLGVMPESISRKSLAEPPGVDYLTGMLLGLEVVDDRLNESHVIIYLGFEDQLGGRFYVPFDFGWLDGRMQVGLLKQSSDEILPTGRLEGEAFGGQMLMDRIKELDIIKKVVEVSILGSGALRNPGEFPSDKQWLVELLNERISAQASLAEELQEFLYQIQRGEMTAEEAGEWANRRVESYDPESILFSSQINYRVVNPDPHAWRSGGN